MKAQKNITKAQFLNSELQNISQVYHGRRNCCRCGCGGEYVATSYMISPRFDINDSLVQKRLNRAKKLVRAGFEVEYGSNYVDVPTGAGRTLTFYFDEV